MSRAVVCGEPHATSFSAQMSLKNWFASAEPRSALIASGNGVPIFASIPGIIGIRFHGVDQSI